MFGFERYTDELDAGGLFVTSFNKLGSCDLKDTPRY